MRRQIRCLLAAPGWSAVYAVEDAENHLYLDPLVAWAVIDDSDSGQPPFESVQGMARSDPNYIGTVESTSNFLGYLAPGESVKYFIEMAQEHLKKTSKDGNKLVSGS